jgi:hypothetical protein
LRGVGVAVADGTETTDRDDVRVHAVRAALVAIEASAERLTTHRGLLTAHQLDELTRTLANDVRHVRLLLNGRVPAVATCDRSDELPSIGASAPTSSLDEPCSVLRPASCTCVPHRGVRLSSAGSR